MKEKESRILDSQKMKETNQQLTKKVASLEEELALFKDR